MIKVDLVTGFLGSGKTSFIREYAGYLIKNGLRVGILENDYGAVNIDRVLLGGLEGERCGIEMVIGGDDHATHLRRFRTKLIALSMTGYDRVIVEPSGVFDPDEFFDVLRDEPLDSWYEPGSVAAVVDASAPEIPESAEQRYLIAAQAANAGKIILSHLDGCSGSARRRAEERTAELLNAVMEEFRCPRRFSEEDFLCAENGAMEEKDFLAFSVCGFRQADHVKLPVERENRFGSVYIMEPGLTRERLEVIISELLGNPEYGRVLRVKGFIPSGSGAGWCSFNVTRTESGFSETDRGQDVFIVIGEELCRERIETLVKQQPAHAGHMV